jgi:hypothetical protein
MTVAMRPPAAWLIPFFLALTGLLDLGAALVHGGGQETTAAALATWAYVATAFGGAVELTAALLISMRRMLGRRLYVLLLPARIILAAGVSLLAWRSGLADGGGAAATSLEGALLRLGLDIAIYATLVFAMYRPAFSQWLTGAMPEPGATADAVPGTRTKSTPVLAHTGVRIALFVAVLLLVVFVLDGPIELLWVGALVVALMLGVRAFLARR